MGTELLRGGVALPLEGANLDHAPAVRAVHAAYRAAGARFLTTNTFGANPYRLAPFRLEREVEAINREGVYLARVEAGSLPVAGSIGPTELQRGLRSRPELERAFRQQAGVLEEAGVDLFVLETFGDVAELRAAVSGIRNVSSRPIVACLTFLPGPVTPLGLSPAAAAAGLSDLPIDVLGVNCAVGDGTCEAALRCLALVTDLPLAAIPNAGTPAVSPNGSLRYPLDPPAFAALLLRLAPFAAILGGCCGTTPEYIALAAALCDIRDTRPR